MSDIQIEAITTLSKSLSASYANAAASTLVVYDIFWAFDREWRHVWSRRWSIPTILYFFCRYYGATSVLFWFLVYAQQQHSVPRCKIFTFITTVTSSVFVQFTCNMIANMRLYALYGRSKILLCFLTVLFISSFVGELYASVRVALITNSGMIPTPPELPLAGCISKGPVINSPLITWIWAISMAVDLIQFTLMMAKFIEHIIKMRKFKGRNPNDRQDALAFTPVLRAFYSTGTIWYFAQTAVTVTYVGVYYASSGQTRVLINPWISLVQSISGSRLILNLRESDSMERHHQDGSNLTALSSGKSPSTLVFEDGNENLHALDTLRTRPDFG